ncbi:MAG: MiaB/RimO family radical SAM methylthiotransferase [Lachnospiraceae bacterium]|nr:MiaB/RimO family radical SAM methylthiotransferase [Lachnospiraceae bacterium]
MKFTIKTIGCKVNTYESNKIKDELIKLGLVYIDVENKNEYKNLDFYIVNTCSVTSIADKKSRQMLHLAKKYNPNVKVIAIGCMVDSLSVGTDIIRPTVGAKLASPHLDGVDYLLSNKEKSKLTDLISTIICQSVGDDILSSLGQTECPPLQVNGDNTIRQRIRSFIKIQDGCNQYCTYCIIPFLRGNIKSRDNDDIINEVKEKVRAGVKEIVLTGIHLSSFGLDRVGLQYENEGAIEVARKSLLEIMTQVAEIDGIERIRLGSLEPRIIDDYFLKFLVGDDNLSHCGRTECPPLLAKKFCANFCLSLQSGCDKTLRRMNRHYTTTDFEKACKLIREYMTYATITTDVIVGFPGETEDDFNESLEFVKKMRFYNPNIFPYSRRKGTKADEMPNQLTNEEKHRRSVLMISECEKISKEIEQDYLKNYEDKANDVLIEEFAEIEGITYGIGYTKEYIKCKKIMDKKH